MQPTIPNTWDFEIMLKIVPIDGIGLTCVALEMSRTFLMLWLAWNNCIMCIYSSNNLTILLNCQVLIFVTLVTWLHTCIDLCFLKLNTGNKYGPCSMLKKCPDISSFVFTSWFVILLHKKYFRWSVVHDAIADKEENNIYKERLYVSYPSEKQKRCKWQRMQRKW
jgi:hypothetical protein